MGENWDIKDLEQNIIDRRNLVPSDIHSCLKSSISIFKGGEHLL
jgi:hypothetical protein